MASQLKYSAGFTYLAVLFSLAIMGAASAMTGVIWSTVQRRERERDLLYVGNEFRKAIGTYYKQTPGTVKRYPNSLEDLLKDNRQLLTTRHLRHIYMDPMTLTVKWGIIRASDGGIKGVYSLSTGRPLKQSGFLMRDIIFERADSYTKWQFVFEPTPRDGEKLESLIPTLAGDV